MINLIVTDKEAVAVHMVYYLGAMLVSGDAAISIVAMTRNVCDCLTENFNDEERDALKLKLTRLGASVAPDVLAKMRVRILLS